MHLRTKDLREKLTSLVSHSGCVDIKVFNSGLYCDAAEGVSWSACIAQSTDMQVQHIV